MGVDDEIWQGESADSGVAPRRAESELPPPLPTDAAPVGARAAADGDSPWSPGSGAVFAAPPAPVVETPTRSTHDAPPTSTPAVYRVVAVEETIALPRRRSGRRRWIGASLAAAVAIVVVVVVRSAISADLATELAPAGTNAPVGDLIVTSKEFLEPLVTDSFAGADRRRLPSQLDERWRVDVEGVAATGRTQLHVLDGGSVVGVLGDDASAGGSVVVLLDGSDGSLRWRRTFDSPPRAVDVLGSFEGVIVLEGLDADNRSLSGLSTGTGDVVWSREATDLETREVLHGTPLIARTSPTADSGVSFIAAATGDDVGEVSGELLGTDFLGTWFVRSGDTISRLDLRDGWNEPTSFETSWVDDDEPVGIVGDRVVAIDGGTLEVRGDDGYPTSVATIGAAGSRGFADLDTGATFTQLFPMVGGAFVAVGSRSVFGAELDEDGDVEVRWSASGIPIESLPTDRGLAFVLAADGGALQWVIDASTGREIALVEMSPGSLDALQLAGNGLVIKRSALVGFERVGLDLDGNRLWSLVGDGPLAIGRGVVATHVGSDAGVAITAYGDPAS